MVKMALTVGINKHPRAPLRGCVNDSNLIKDILTNKFGYSVSQLLDEQATKKAFMEGISTLANQSKPGDNYVIHISSHGTQIPDQNFDESDGLDEAFVLFQEGDNFRDCLVIDDEINDVLRQFDGDARVTVLIDCCHSGTGTRALMFHASQLTASINRFLPAPELEKDYVKMLSEIPRALGVFAWLMSLLKSPAKEAPATIVNPKVASVLFSACKSSEYAADAFIDGNFYGAFTKSLVTAIGCASPATVDNVYYELSKTIKQRFEQTPQLEVRQDTDKIETIFS